jgi:hypothetical protein
MRKYRRQEWLEHFFAERDWKHVDFIQAVRNAGGKIDATVLSRIIKGERTWSRNNDEAVAKITGRSIQQLRILSIESKISVYALDWECGPEDTFSTEFKGYRLSIFRQGDGWDGDIAHIETGNQVCTYTGNPELMEIMREMLEHTESVINTSA